MGVQHPRFRQEVFIPLRDRANRLVGFSELLFTPLRGQLAENFFKVANNATIHKIFEWAVAHAVRTGQKASVNIQPAALYNPEFLSVLRRIKENNPTLDPRNIMIEITEHGRTPLTSNQAKLLKLMKDLEFCLALDDVDPVKPSEAEPSEIDRLKGYAPYVDVIKFSYLTMQYARGKNTGKAAEYIQELRQHFPNAVCVMEGVRPSDIEDFYYFLSQSVDCIQLSRYRQPSADSLPTLYAALP